jgi:hypothetical protein
MKNLTILAIITSAAFISLNANADALMDIIHPESADLFPSDTITIQEQEVTMVEDTGREVWRIEFEQWVNPADFNPTNYLSVTDVNQAMENNPPAAGNSRSNSVLTWDEVADEYYLQ